MSENGTTPVVNVHTAAVQERISEIRGMQSKIPNFVVPTSKDDNRKLVSAAAVPPPFVQLTIVTTEHSPALVLGGSAKPEEVRDLLLYADAYEPFAEELEAMASFVRHSAKAARNKAGHNALMTYEVAKRLSKRPETAYLAPAVEAMRRALPARKRKAAKPADTPAPDPATTQTA